MKKIYFISAILITASVSGFSPSVSAQPGMPLPRCDEILDPEFYYEEYIDADDFKTLHSTFKLWERLPDNYEYKAVCINENGKALLMWSFNLPSSLSKYQFSYKYKVALGVNWDKSAQIVHEITPEELILIAESLPEVNEFITAFLSETTQTSKWKDLWIRSSSYIESTGSASPLQINYSTDNFGSVAVSEKGVDWADLNIHQDWINFPTVKIGANLVENALTSKDCTTDTSPTAVSRYSPRGRKNEEEPEEFIYNSYKISCPGDKYRYSMVNISPHDGRFTVWLENRIEIASGKISDSDLEKIQALLAGKLSEYAQAATTVSSPTVTVSPPPAKQTKSTNLKLFIIAGATALILIIPLVYLLIRKLKKPKKIIEEIEKSEAVPSSNIEQIPTEARPQDQSENDTKNPQNISPRE